MGATLLPVMSDGKEGREITSVMRFGESGLSGVLFGVGTGLVSSTVGLDCALGRCIMVLLCIKASDIFVESCLERPGVDLLVCMTVGRAGLCPIVGSDSPSYTAGLVSCNNDGSCIRRLLLGKYKAISGTLDDCNEEGPSFVVLGSPCGR